MNRIIKQWGSHTKLLFLSPVNKWLLSKTVPNVTQLLPFLDEQSRKEQNLWAPERQSGFLHIFWSQIQTFPAFSKCIFKIFLHLRALVKYMFICICMLEMFRSDVTVIYTTKMMFHVDLISCSVQQLINLVNSWFSLV